MAQPRNLLSGQERPVGGVAVRFRNEQPDSVGPDINDCRAQLGIADCRLQIVDRKIRGTPSFKSAIRDRQSSILMASLVINDLSGATTMDFTLVIVTRPGGDFRGFRTCFFSV